jgi:prophage antirepressor-like protein
MENNIQIFTASEFGELGVVTIDGKYYFPATYCAKILGYSEPEKAIRTHCKGVSVLDTPSNGGIQRKKYVSEGDVYRLIMRSKLPAAERFERWVCDTILPSIRKHGAYITDEKIRQIEENSTAITELVEALKDEMEYSNCMELEICRKNVEIEALQEKAEYADFILGSSEILSITQIAKEYGFSARKMNKLLHALDIQYKANGQWVLYADYQNKGYTQSVPMLVKNRGNFDDPSFIMHTKWTFVGAAFIHREMQNLGIPTLYERQLAFDYD